MSVQQTPSWEWISTFLEVMREGSLSGASRSLRVAQPTVRRRIVALEDHLGSALFSRSPNGLIPTELAQRMRPFAETMEATSQTLVRTASAEPNAVAGTVRIATSPLFGTEVLPGVLRTLHQKYPRLQVEVLASGDVVDLTRGEADIAIRMAPLTGASLVARRVGSVLFGFFASADYLNGRAMPEALSDLRDHELIGYDRHPQLIDGYTAMGLSVERRDFWVRTDDDLAYLGHIRAGLGVGMTQVPLAGDLVRVLPDLTYPLDLWLVAHRDLRDVHRIRAVLDHLADALQPFTGPAES